MMGGAVFGRLFSEYCPDVPTRTAVGGRSV